jgi:hypothetical protein
MVEGNEDETWFKMQVWMLRFLIRDFKESDGAIIDAHSKRYLEQTSSHLIGKLKFLSWLARPLASMSRTR